MIASEGCASWAHGTIDCAFRGNGRSKRIGRCSVTTRARRSQLIERITNSVGSPTMSIAVQHLYGYGSALEPVSDDGCRPRPLVFWALGPKEEAHVAEVLIRIPLAVAVEIQVPHAVPIDA